MCNCEGTMDIDAQLLSDALNIDTELSVNKQLCRSQIEIFEKAVKQHDELIVACTQEAPMFLETTDTIDGKKANLSFTNIRERAGWTSCKNKKNKTAKMAALISEAAIEIPQTPSVTMKSVGELVIIGDGDIALQAGENIKDRLNVTIILSGKEDVLPPRIMDFPIFSGEIESLNGHLGSFQLKINNYSPATPASRDKLLFNESDNVGSLSCDLVLDLSDADPLLRGHTRRDGYIKPITKNIGAINEALIKLSNFVGEFEKPKYIDFEANLCAHSRSEISGCNRCLDNCPIGAITSKGDTVEIDPYTCAGCGICSAVCPTGAAKYSVPAENSLITRIHTVLSSYLLARGQSPTILFHDTSWGVEMISMLARNFDGLPSHILPLAVNSPSQLGLDHIFSAAAFGASEIIYLFSKDKSDEKNALEEQRQIANLVLEELGYGKERVRFFDDADPEKLQKIMWELEERSGLPAGDFLPMGRKRSIMSLALKHLHKYSPRPVDLIELPQGSPFGGVKINSDGCTLCLSCVGACPTGALKANNDKPQLSFSETACVQCGLCKNTCPESVISLQPRLSFLAEANNAIILKEELPFECVECGKPFGTTSTIERMIKKLENHPMFNDEDAINRLKMCDDCRIISMTKQTDNPMAIGIVPKPRTTDDYLREREELRRNAEKDMLDKGLLPPKNED